MLSDIQYQQEGICAGVLKSELLFLVAVFSWPIPQISMNIKCFYFIWSEFIFSCSENWIHYARLFIYMRGAVIAYGIQFPKYQGMCSVMSTAWSFRGSSNIRPSVPNDLIRSNIMTPIILCPLDTECMKQCQLYNSPVRWGCRIYQLHLCRGVRLPQWVSSTWL